MKPFVWSIKDIVDVLKARQNNEFDGNFVVSGDRGNGKSTLISKIFYRMGKFNPWKHQVYTRDDLLKLLKTQKRGRCFDDEAVNSGYKRDFQNKAQQELIKIVTAYRDNFNIYASAIPNFFSLDKDLRDLMFMHIHVINRGIAVIHTPIKNLMYSIDKWDTRNNQKVEMSWTIKTRQDPNFRPKFNRLSTFRGYLYFADLTPKQKKIYLSVKLEKRKYAFETIEDKEETFNQRIYSLLIEGKIERSSLIDYCILEGKKYSTILSTLNNMLTDNGIKETATEYFKDSNKKKISYQKDQINDIVPHL